VVAPLLLSTDQTSNNRVVLRTHAEDEAEERRLAGLQPGERRQAGTGGPDKRQPDLLRRVAARGCSHFGLDLLQSQAPRGGNAMVAVGQKQPFRGVDDDHGRQGVEGPGVRA
jgi:hypothetical protein